MEYDLQKTREFFQADRFATGMGAVVDAVSADSVVCSLDIRPEHLNAASSVQGGAIFTLADLAFAVHANLELANGAAVGVTVGQSNSISFLHKPKGSRLIARTICLHHGKTMSVYRIAIEDEHGSPVAEMHGNAFTTAP